MARKHSDDRPAAEPSAKTPRPARGTRGAFRAEAIELLHAARTEFARRLANFGLGERQDPLLTSTDLADGTGGET